jgi:hypothetical protein
MSVLANLSLDKAYIFGYFLLFLDQLKLKLESLSEGGDKQRLRRRNRFSLAHEIIDRTTLACGTDPLSFNEKGH